MVKDSFETKKKARQHIVEAGKFVQYMNPEESGDYPQYQRKYKSEISHAKRLLHKVYPPNHVIFDELDLNTGMGINASLGTLNIGDEPFIDMKRNTQNAETFNAEIDTGMKDFWNDNVKYSWQQWGFERYQNDRLNRSMKSCVKDWLADNPNELAYMVQDNHEINEESMDGDYDVPSPQMMKKEVAYLKSVLLKVADEMDKNGEWHKHSHKVNFDAETFHADSKEEARLKKYEKTYGKEGAKVRNRIFKRILAKADWGTKAGQWSARKAQALTDEYEEAMKGKGKKAYKTSKRTKTQKSLKKWGDQNWKTKSGQDSSKTGERYLPEKAIKALTDKEYKKTSAKKRKDTKKGKQFSKQPKDIAKKVKKYRGETFDAESRPHSVDVSRSTNKEKKLMAVFEDKDGKKIKTTHFGARGMSDYTKHGDKERMERYNKRHKKNEHWNRPMTAGALSKHILWNKPSLAGSFNDYKRRFGLKGDLKVSRSAESFAMEEYDKEWNWRTGRNCPYSDCYTNNPYQMRALGIPLYKLGYADIHEMYSGNLYCHSCEKTVDYEYAKNYTPSTDYSYDNAPTYLKILFEDYMRGYDRKTGTYGDEPKPFKPFHPRFEEWAEKTDKEYRAKYEKEPKGSGFAGFHPYGAESFNAEKWSGQCHRCDKKTNTHTMSWFNTDLICMDCSNKEKSHPKYQEAKDKELEQVKKGNYNFEGIGFDAEGYSPEMEKARQMKNRYIPPNFKVERKDGRKYLFLDFDNTVRHTIPDPKPDEPKRRRPPHKAEEVVLIDGVKERVHEWADAGYFVVGLTNQSNIESGFNTTQDVVDAIKRTLDLLDMQFPVYFASHKNKNLPDYNYRKPMTGMIDAAFRDFGSPNHTYSLMVGDDWEGADSGMAENAGVHFIGVLPFIETPLPQAEQVMFVYTKAGELVSILNPDDLIPTFAEEYDRKMNTYSAEDSYSKSATSFAGNTMKMSMGTIVGVVGALILGYNAPALYNRYMKKETSEAESSVDSTQSLANQGFMEDWTGGNEGDDNLVSEGNEATQPSVSYSYDPFATSDATSYDPLTRPPSMV